MKTFLWLILFLKKLNSGHYIQADKIFGTVKKVGGHSMQCRYYQI